MYVHIYIYTYIHRPVPENIGVFVGIVAWTVPETGASGQGTPKPVRKSKSKEGVRLRMARAVEIQHEPGERLHIFAMASSLDDSAHELLRTVPTSTRSGAR